MLPVESAIRAAAKRAEVDSFDALVTRSEQIAARFDDAPVVQSGIASSVVVRVWLSPDRIGVARTSGTGEVELNQAFLAARDAAAIGEPVPEAPQLLEGRTVDSSAVLGPDQVEDVQKMIRILEDSRAAAFRVDSRITHVPYHGVTSSRNFRTRVSSIGDVQHCEWQQSSHWLKAQSSVDGRRGRSWVDASHGRRISDLETDALADRVARHVVRTLDYQRAESAVWPVVMTGETFVDLVRGFASVFSGVRLAEGRSLLQTREIDSVIASRVLSIRCDANHPQNLIGSRFDDEGSVRRPLSLVEDGKLSGFFQTCGSARKTGGIAMGHAKLGAKLEVAPNFLVVSNRDASTSVPKWGRHIRIDGLHAFHAGANQAEGTFSLPISGWIVEEDGRRVSIEAATVSGDFLQVLESIVHVGSEDGTNKVSIDGVSPDVWISGLSITGE